LGRFDFVIFSLAEIAGYLLAAATFMALAGTLKAGAHIRMTMFLAVLPEPWRRQLEMWALGFGAAAAAWMTGRLALLAQDSWRFNEVSVGVLPIPLAIPQAVMVLGGAALAIALVDELVVVARSGRPTFRATEDSLTLGKKD
jgi:TRAP-type C4-dicarboxylate transport system permease small subunit